jgi:gliding motility-associated-like protein
LTKAVTTGLAADTFAVQIKDTVSGCAIDTSFALKFQPDFKVAVSMTKPTCNQATGIIALSVSPGPISNYTFSKSFTSDSLKNLVSGTYEAFVTRAGSSCSFDTLLFLGNQTDFGVVATITDPSCGKSDGKIQLSTTKGSNSDYTFTLNNLNQDSLVNIPAGVYHATVKQNGTSCTKDTSFVIGSKPDFQVTATSIFPSCNASNGAILMSFVPGPATNYTVSGTGGLTKDSSTNLTTGSYPIHIKRAGSACEFDTTVVLDVPGTPLVELGNNDTICDAKTIRLKAKITDSLATTYMYTWYAGADSLSTVISVDTLSVQPSTSTTYYVKVSNGTSCPGTDSIRLVRPARILLTNTSSVFSQDGQIELDFKVINPIELPKDTVYVYSSSSKGKVWKQIATLSAKDSVYKGELASRDTVYYYQIAFPGKNTCAVPLASGVQRNILIHSTTDPDPQNETTSINWSTFIGWDSAVYEYQIWRSLDGGPMTYYNSGNLDTLASFLNNASDGREQCYRIKAIEIGPNGHESWSNTVCVHYENKIKAYNIFTPNGDGHNDVFFFKNLHFYPGSELYVFNRWGDKVFHQANYTNDWDGGNLPAGTYFYMLDTKDGGKALTGDVLLHR